MNANPKCLNVTILDYTVTLFGMCEQAMEPQYGVYFGNEWSNVTSLETECDKPAEWNYQQGFRYGGEFTTEVKPQYEITSHTIIPSHFYGATCDITESEDCICEELSDGLP